MSLVSVILPCCDSERWIRDAIESVLWQTYQTLELIIVDDHSSDNTRNILDEYAHDPRIVIIKRDKCSGGPATPRNNGIELAKGKYLAFIDSDDAWHPRKLELQISAMQTNGLNFISTLRTDFKESVPSAHSIDHTNIKVKNKTHDQLLNKNWVVTSSAVVAASLLKPLRFNQANEYVGVEDYLLWLYIHQKTETRSAIMNEPLVFYRLREHSISSSKRVMASKIFYLLSTYQVNGRLLGLKKYYYFTTYVLLSLAARIPFTPANEVSH